MAKRERHTQAGIPVKIQRGPLKGRYFIVSDYLINQYQGKPIEKIAQGSGAELLLPLKRRKLPVDDDAVFGKLYPTMEQTCVHDSELQVAEGESVKEEELPAEVATLTAAEEIKEGDAVVEEEGKAKKARGASGKKAASKAAQSGSTPDAPAKESKGDKE